MPCFSRLGLVAVIAAVVVAGVVAGACSIFNAPEDVIGGGGGGAQTTTTSSTGASTTSSSSSTSSTTTSTSGGCHADTDCPASPSACHAYSCVLAASGGGTCVLGQLADATPCDDGFYCTVGDACKAGACAGLPRSCPDENACNVGACDEQAQMCAFAEGNEGASCDDGNPCDGPGTCMSGNCRQGLDTCTPLQTACLSATCVAEMGCVTAGPQVFFSDDFDDASKGWTLGPEWQIGKATVSHGQSPGFYPDPGVDHTMDAANGVAGVEIGGNASTMVHASYYLTSPAIDTTTATGSVYLTFYRWLNSDVSPFMVSTVEASADGVAWTVVWTTAAVATTDMAWTFQSFDVTAYKSATTHVRFGFSVGNAMVFTVSSWNLDDVKVQSLPCPM
jgi:hypothetical protein